MCFDFFYVVCMGCVLLPSKLKIMIDSILYIVFGLCTFPFLIDLMFLNFIVVWWIIRFIATL